MTRTSNARSIGAASRLAGAALLAAALFPAPAAAEQARAILSVTATVLPTCQVSAGASAGPEVRCSSGTSWTSATATRTGSRPLDQAASILGAPVRDSGRVVLSGDAGAAQRTTGTTSYLTITY